MEHVSLRIDHQNFEEESDMEDGGHDKATKEILKNPDDGPQQKPSKFHRRWDKIFLILCEIALFLDPLFCYIPFIDSSDLCYSLDLKLWIIFLFSRSAIDLFYAMDIFIFSRRILTKRTKHNAKTFWTDSKRTVSNRKGYKPVMVDVIYKLSLVIFRIFVAVPIPQAIIITGKFSNIGLSIPLLLFYPIQYTLRAYGTYKLIKQNRPDIETEIGRWLKAILDFLPFVIAAHLFGAVWYYFALDREIHCWRRYCVDGDDFRDLCDPAYAGYYFRCGSMPFSSLNATLLIREVCASSPANGKFNFGIYSYALESKVTRLGFHPRKVILCFWWGLRNMSSFGSDLKTSPDMMESTLSVLVSISGMALFLVYLNARVQWPQKRSEQLKLSRKMKIMKPVIDFWLSEKGLPEDMNKVIRRKVQQELRKNIDVDVQNLLAILPQQQRAIMCQLRLASLKKVPKLEELNERVLKAICKHLEPVTYPKNNYIIHVGEQLWNMFFITQGTVLTYTTSTNTNVCGANTSGSSSAECLKKGDFFGEELVTWAFSFGSFSDLPVSTRTVMSKTKVEAFAISANDLESIVSEFRIYFSRKLPPQDHYQLENLAASYIQDAWRSHYARSQASKQASKLGSTSRDAVK